MLSRKLTSSRRWVTSSPQPLSTSDGRFTSFSVSFALPCGSTSSFASLRQQANHLKRSPPCSKTPVASATSEPPPGRPAPPPQSLPAWREDKTSRRSSAKTRSPRLMRLLPRRPSKGYVQIHQTNCITIKDAEITFTSSTLL